MNFLISAWPHDFFLKLYEQLLLVGLATGLAIIAGIPLSIFVFRKPQLKRTVLGLTNVLQTIPSLALLAFLIPFLGIGMKPAVLAISLYCLLPIIQNTLIGLENLPSEMKEASLALGFNFWQKLWFVELPLALPVIIAGIRIAVVMAVGMATLAALIGAGGLGDYITQGLALNDHRLILLGAIPAAILALCCDRLISFFESMMRRKQFPFKWLSALMGVLFAALFGCVIVGGTKICSSEISNDVIRVASKNFSEQFILSEIMAQLIEAKTSLKVQRKLNLGSTDIVHQAMLRGEVDLYSEYTGTAYLTVLHFGFNHTISDIFKIVQSAYGKQFDLVWLPPFGFNNANALLVTRAFADKHKLQTISGLSRLKNPVTIGAPPEFVKREDGYQGLLKTYGLHFSRVIQMDPALLYQALVNDDVSVVVGFTTDGQIPAYQLHALVDDKQFYPPYQAAPVIRKAVLQRHPELQPLLATLAGRISDDTMRALNARIAIQHQSPQGIAHDFLIEQKLI